MADEKNETLQSPTLEPGITFDEGTDEESGEYHLSGSERIVHTQPGDPEVESLYRKVKRGKLVLQPDFQRAFVWDRARSSRLIESVLLSVPLPVIYLAQESDGKEAVIDGQQRLTALFSFMDGHFPDKEAFRLSGLKVFPELNKKAFSELSEQQQDKIRYYKLRVITVLPNSDADLKFEVFERLNTGAEPLNDMELRNCVYRGGYMGVLKDLAKDPVFMEVLGVKTPDKRMRDVELVLRFAAFYHATYLKYQSPMKSFFNRDMERFRNLTKSEEEELRRAFHNAVQIVKSLFGPNAFRRFTKGRPDDPSGSWETKFNASLYDVMMGVFADRDKNQVYSRLDALREGLINLMAVDTDFIDSILLGTSQPIRVRKRFDLARQTVEGILAHTKVQPRCFSFELKRKLWEENSTCALCGQQIIVIDDAAVDHIEQYWRGGMTIPENARLAHRFCNAARPRNE